VADAKIDVELTTNAKDLKKAHKEQAERERKLRRERSSAEASLNKDQTKANADQLKAINARAAAERKRFTAAKGYLKQEAQIFSDFSKKQLSHVKNLATASTKALRTVGGKMGGSGGFMRGVGGAALGVGGAIAGFVAGGASAAYGKYAEYGQALGNVIGLDSGRNISGGINRAPGARLGFSKIDAAKQVAMMGRATGVVGPGQFQQARRATGMTDEETMAAFSGLRQAGTTFTGRGETQGGRQLKQIISAGFVSGLEKSRFPEFMSGITSLTERVAARTTGAVDPTAIAHQLAFLGKTGKPGLQGARGAQVMGAIDKALISPGGGDFGAQFIRMAMGFGKQKGGVSFVEAEKRREKGVEDPQNMFRLLGEVGQQFGFGDEGALAMRELTGLSVEQSQSLLEVASSGKSAEEQLAAIKEITKESDSIEKQSLEAMKGIGGYVKHLASMDNQLIGIGATVAPVIQALEKLQVRALKALIDLASDVGAIYSFLKDFWSDKFQSSEDVQERLDEYESVRRHNREKGAKDIEELRAHREEEARMLRVSASTVSKAQSGAWGTVQSTLATTREAGRSIPGIGKFVFGEGLSESEKQAQQQNKIILEQRRVGRESSAQQQTAQLLADVGLKKTADQRLTQALLSSPVPMVGGKTAMSDVGTYNPEALAILSELVAEAKKTSANTKKSAEGLGNSEAEGRGSH